MKWLPIPGYEGIYEVSDTGLIRSVARTVLRSNGSPMRVQSRMLSQQTGQLGRKSISLSKNGSTMTFRVHRLVLEAFVGPAPEGFVCCHFDGNAGNNNLSNLRWDTLSANRSDALRHGTHYPASKQRCEYGHEFTLANTYLPPGNPHRECRTCRALNASKRNQEKRRRRRVAGQKLYADYTTRDIADIRDARAAGESYRSIAERYPLSWATIRRICLDQVKALKVGQ